jgi:hypothetical protein
MRILLQVSAFQIELFPSAPYFELQAIHSSYTSPRQRQHRTWYIPTQYRPSPLFRSLHARLSNSEISTNSDGQKKEKFKNRLVRVVVEYYLRTGCVCVLWRGRVCLTSDTTIVSIVTMFLSFSQSLPLSRRAYNAYSE